MAIFLLVAATPATPLDITRTVYHVNPTRFGPIPRDTDSADPVGDLFFEMQQVLNFPLTLFSRLLRSRTWGWTFA